VRSTYVQKTCTYNVNEIDTCRQFHQRFTGTLFYNILVPKNFKPITQLYIFWCQNFVQKTCTNIDEIDFCPKSISPKFYEQILFCQKITKANSRREKLKNTLSYERAAFKMLVKLTTTIIRIDGPEYGV